MVHYRELFRGTYSFLQWREEKMSTRFLSKKHTALLGILLICFVSIYAKHARLEISNAVKEHARIIATDLWNFNPSSAAEYLHVAAIHYNYKTVKVYSHADELFLEASAHKAAWHPPPAGPFLPGNRNEKAFHSAK